VCLWCDQRVAMPRDGEEDPSVASVRDENRAIAGEKTGVKDQVNALARNDHWLGGGFRFLTQCIGEGTSGINDHSCRRAKFLARFNIACCNSVHEPLVVFEQRRDFRVVEKRGALLVGGDGHMDQKAGIVKLTVEVNRTPTQASVFRVGRYSSVSSLDNMRDVPKPYFPARSW